MCSNIKREEFKKYRDAIFDELSDASYRYRLGLKIQDEIPMSVFNQTSTFWGVLFESLEDSSIISLAKVYEKRPDTINLANFLEFVQKNRIILNLEITDEQIELDLQILQSQSTRSRLQAVRGNFVAHRNKGYVLENKDKTNSSIQLTCQDFEELIDQGFELVNYYSKSFDSFTKSKEANLAGRDDYKTIFKAVEILNPTMLYVSSQSFEHKEISQETSDFIESIQKISSSY